MFERFRTFYIQQSSLQMSPTKHQYSKTSFRVAFLSASDKVCWILSDWKRSGLKPMDFIFVPCYTVFYFFKFYVIYGVFIYAAFIKMRENYSNKYKENIVKHYTFLLTRSLPTMRYRVMRVLTRRPRVIARTSLLSF